MQQNNWAHQNGIGGAPTNYWWRQRADHQKSAVAAGLYIRCTLILPLFFIISNVGNSDCLVTRFCFSTVCAKFILYFLSM